MGAITTRNRLTHEGFSQLLVRGGNWQHFLSIMWIPSVMILMVLWTLPNARANQEDYSGQAYQDSLGQQQNYYNYAQVYQNPPPVNINYFGILYGPSLGRPTGYQPDLNGVPDRDRPIIIKNFLTVSRNLSEQVGVAATGFFSWQPVVRQKVQFEDPFLKVSYNSLYNKNGFNLYGDMRFHFPVSTISRMLKQSLAIQTFQALTYEVMKSRMMLGAYLSQKYNFIGVRNFGNDMEFYIAPNISYQLLPNLSFSLLFEMFASHSKGKRFGSFNGEGTDLEPGLIWEITPNVMLNPYLNIMTSGKVGWDSTSFGMMLSLTLL